ncbi:MAG: FtsX-like permease family protein [Bacteroidia bacterium]
MRSSWQKINRDIQANRSRVLLGSLAIMVASFVLMTVSSSFWVLRREIARDFLETHPQDASLVFALDSSKNIVDSLKAMSGIEAAELRQSLEGRIEIAPNVWRRIILFAVHDFAEQGINQAFPERGAKIPAIGEVLIERACVSVAETQIGEDIKVLIGRGTKQSLKVSGVVHDPAQAPGWMHSEVFGYIRPGTMSLLGLPVAESKVSLRFKTTPQSLAQSRQNVKRIRDALENQGFDIYRSIVPPPATHPHQRQLETLLSLLMVFSVLSLLLSGVVVANITRGFMFRQIRQIGIMKTIGGENKALQKLYAGFFLFMIVLAIPLGWLLSIPASRAFMDFVVGQLNFSLANAWPPLGLMLLQWSLSFAIPFGFGMWSLRQVLKKTALEALDDHGLPQNDLPKTKTDFLGRLLSPAMRLSLRNAFRQRRRAWLTITSLGLGGAAFMASFNVQAAWVQTVADVQNQQRHDVDIRFGEAVFAERLDSVLSKLPSINMAEYWSSDLVYARFQDRTESLRFSLVTMPEDARFFEPQIIEGRAPNPNARAIEGMANRALTFLESEIKVGQCIEIIQDTALIKVKIVGINYEADAPPTVYLAQNQLDSNNEGARAVSFLRISHHEHTEQSQSFLLKELEEVFAEEGILVASSKEAHVIDQNFADHFSIIINILLIVAILLGLVGFLGLSSTMSMNVLERIREYGIMQAIGATQAQVYWQIIGEVGLLATVSWGVACLLAIPFSYGVGNVIGKVGLLRPLELQIDGFALMACLLGMLLISFLLGLLPIIELRRNSIRNVFQYE